MGSCEDGRVSLELTLAARMGLAALLGFLIGLEREHRGKSAGERTFAIVALGASGIAGLAFTMFPVTAGQAVAGVATGIGFLGVGIIWRAGEGQTLGLTTAASISASPRSGSSRGSAFTSPPSSGPSSPSSSWSSTGCPCSATSTAARPAVVSTRTTRPSCR